MESVGALGSPSGVSYNLLSLPASCPWDEEDESLGLEGIKPKSSPIPRRRSSVSSDDSLPPPSTSRRVSFADTFGLSLVSVKQFDSLGVTAPSGPLESDLNKDKEYYMVPLFTLPQTAEELALRVHNQKLELESLELLSGTSTLRGIVRVLNVCFDKMVYVRTSLDSWRSHFDLLAEYIPGSNNGGMDCFTFKITLVPPFGGEGARVDFCLRCDTSFGSFWANNNENNYSLFCCERIREKPLNVCENRRKSCLKTTSPNVSASTVAATNNEESPDINLNSEKATGPESLKENSEKLEKEDMEVKEISRIRSRRSRRRAARLAKVKEHFAKREEENKQGTMTIESGVTAETSIEQHASVLEKTPCSPQSKQIARPPTYNQIAPSPDESLKSTEYCGYFTDIYSQAVIEHKEAMINTKTNLFTAHTNIPIEDCGELVAYSASEALGNIRLTEDLTDQKGSINQSFPEFQNPDLSVCKNVEKAWEHFEKGAKKRIEGLALSSKTDEDTNISGGKTEENVSLKTTNSEPKPFSHGFTFGNIVAPLYHQVFKNMETQRNDFFLKTLQVDRSLRELEDESLTAVTAAETTGFWPESCISTKQTVHDISVGACNESTEQSLQLTLHPTKNPLSEPNMCKHVEISEASRFQNDYTGVIREYKQICFAAQTCITLFDGEHHTLEIKEVEGIDKIKNDESQEEGNGNQIKQIEKEKQHKEKKDQEPKEQQGAEEKHEDTGGINSIEEELKYIDDEEDLDVMKTERKKKQQADDLLSVERGSEEQKQNIRTSHVKSLPQNCISLNEIENLGGFEDSEEQDRDFKSGVEICEETATSGQESSQKCNTELSESMQSMENDWGLIEFIDKEDNMCCGSENSDRETTDDVNHMLENMDCQSNDSMNRDLENAEDNTSTESQIDDEMELYLLSLRNSQQSVFKEGTKSGSYGKRPSVSKGRPLAMPSISESVDEDQTNSSLEDLTNIDYIMELERTTLPLVDRNEHAIGRNVLWWKEFLSYDNLSRVIGYTFLLIVFLFVAYYYDFIACFALYLLTVYWLFRQGEEEPLKNSRKGERRKQ